MSLVYFITTLPKIRRAEVPQISSEELVERAYQYIEGPHRQELERLFLLEEVEETVRVMSAALIEDPEIAASDLSHKIFKHRRPAKSKKPPGELPHFVLEPTAQHVLLRRWYQTLYEEAESAFLKAWAKFSLNLEEAMTGYLCKKDNLPKDDFSRHMSGSFDSTARVLLERYDGAEIGLQGRLSFFDTLKSALESPDFEQMERDINTIRWHGIEQLLSPQTFSIDAVLAYYLKLRIIEREASFSLEAGEHILDSILKVEVAA